MKKKLIIFVFISILLIFIKYYTSDYTIKYQVNNYDVLTVYKDNRLYYEITNKKEKYNFDIYTSRKLSKTRIKEIKTIKDETITCIYPVIKDFETYPLCYENGIYKDYNLIESELLTNYQKNNNTEETETKDFEYYNILNKDQYVALWNYNGYIVMNDKSYENIELFKKDTYDNSNAYIVNETIYMPNYDQEYEYSQLVTLNLKNHKTSKIEIGYNIDSNSYIVGNIGKYLYIFDDKHSILYEINIKKQETKIVSNNEIGYKKYNGKEFVKCSKSEYKVDKIKYNFFESNYTYKYNEGLYKKIKENKIEQFINKNDIKIIKEYQNQLYYSHENSFYMYTPLEGNKKIFYNYELKYNNNNNIFVYINSK